MCPALCSSTPCATTVADYLTCSKHGLVLARRVWSSQLVGLNRLTMNPPLRELRVALITGFFQNRFKSAHPLALFQEKRHGFLQNGRPHRDLLHPDGTQDKQEFHNFSREEVLTIGERDIKANWRRYRAQYERERTP